MEWAGVVGGGERAYVRTGIARNSNAYIRGRMERVDRRAIPKSRRYRLLLGTTFGNKVPQIVYFWEWPVLMEMRWSADEVFALK